tara:strand:+ start:851 stop:1744 length:894 start_codon:yes stop_codon:yes gene_type:complete
VGNFNNNLIAKWRERFEVMVRLTLGIPIILAGLQLALVGNQLSFDLTKLATWTNTEKVFALPLGAFALFAAVTSLIGLYHRSMLLNRQLEKVQEQIAISNKQFKRSEEQFKLSQEQFALAAKKENYYFYTEHCKKINEEVSEHINNLESFISENKNKYGRFLFDFRIFYELCFPENKYDSMLVFEHKAQDFHYEEQLTKYKEILSQLLLNSEFKRITNDDLYSCLIKNLFSSGLTYVPKYLDRDSDNKSKIIYEVFNSLEIIFQVLTHYRLVKVETCEQCKHLIKKLEQAYIGANFS